MRFPAKKNAGRAISRQEKMAFSPPRRVVVGLPPPPAESVRTDGRTDGHVTIRHNQNFSDR